MNIKAIAAVLAVVTLATVLVPLADDADAADSDYWTFTLNYTSANMSAVQTTTSALSYGTTGLTPVSNTSTALATVTTVGSWGSTDDEYGPFGSFYAVIDTNGQVKGHLKWSDLTEYVDGADASSDITTYNVMWCLPTIYISSTSTSWTITNDPDAGGVAYAHTIGGTVWPYLAIGVYEATSVSGTLKSISGSTPTASQTRETFRTQANANDTGVDSGQGDYMLWNYNQYALYRNLVYLAIQNFNSQEKIGYGNAGGSAANTTGATDGMGPFAGSVTQSGSNSVKAFIENAWGSVWEFVDDCVAVDRVLYVGSNATVTDTTTDKVNSGVTFPSSNNYGIGIYTAGAQAWGTVNAVAGSATTGTTDYVYSNTGTRLLDVGGAWGGAAYAGVGCVAGDSSLPYSGAYVGARLAYVFAADAAASTTYTVNYDANGGANAPAQKIEESGEDSLDVVLSSDYPTWADHTFKGWAASKDATTATYQPGQTVTLTRANSTLNLYAVWQAMVTGITVTGSGDMLTGTSQSLGYTVVPPTADQNVTWSTSRSSVATVSTGGVVTALAAGTVTITATATDGTGVSGSLVITVKQAVTGIAVTGGSSVLTGRTLALTATVTPSGAADKTVSWTSSDDAVATVSDSGVVTGIAAGTATITATAQDGSGVKGSRTIEVVQAATKLAITGADTVLLGSSITLTADTDGAASMLTWKSSSTSTVTLESNGLTATVTGKALGTVTITASLADGSELTATKDITVDGTLATAIEISGTTTIQQGNTTQLTATIAPADATIRTVKWSVASGAYYASVSDDGLVTGSAPGSAKIRATATDGSGVYGEVTIVIESKPVPVTGITVDGPDKIQTGKTGTVTATIAPADATNRAVTWTSSELTVATVDTVGNIKALAAGTTIITATAKDGSGVSGARTITVTDEILIASIGIAGDKSINEGETATLTATIGPENAATKAVTWTLASGSDVITLTADGLSATITGLKTGTATVTCTAADGSGVSSTATIHVVTDNVKTTKSMVMVIPIVMVLSLVLAAVYIAIRRE